MSSYLRVPLARTASSGRQARDVVRAWLVDVGRSNTEYVAAQVVTELVANAVVHAGEPIGLHLWCRRDGVRIGVSDGSTDVATLLPEDPSAPAGRGLHLVERLAAGWGTDVHDRGKLTWAEVTDAIAPPPTRAGDEPAVPSGSGARWHLAWRGEGATMAVPAPVAPHPSHRRETTGPLEAGPSLVLPTTTRARPPERRRGGTEARARDDTESRPPPTHP